MRIKNIEFNDNQIQTNIDSFFDEKRIALVGLSRDKSHFSRAVLNEFSKRGYEVYPVNPNVEKIDDLKVYPSISNIPADVNAALIMLPPENVIGVLNECKIKGINKIWLHRGVGQGSINSAVLTYCKANQFDLIPGFCPLMFMENTMFLHKLHGWFNRLTGQMPVISN